MIYTAPCIMFLMRADTFRGQVGGDWALEVESFLGPVKWHRADRRVPFGAQKNSSFPQQNTFSQHSVFVLIFNNKLGKEISTLCYFFPFSAVAALFFCPLQFLLLVYLLTLRLLRNRNKLLQLSFALLEFIFVCESVERK
jgi:hypothetical protein